MMELYAESFPAHFSNIAQRWFHQLLRNSISSFEELVEKFRTRFITNVPPAKSIHDLRTCRQEFSESLRSYLDRFNKVTMQIENLSDEVAVKALKNGTRLGKLKDKFLTKKPRTFSEVMTIATNLIEMDEDRRLRRDDEKPTFKQNERIDLRRPTIPRGNFRNPSGRIHKRN